MASSFNQTIYVNSMDELYAMQNDILIALTVNDLKLHMVDASHVCEKIDKFGFLTNRMEDYKCIIIPSILREEAFRFSKIIENETGHEIYIFAVYAATKIYDALIVSEYLDLASAL